MFGAGTCGKYLLKEFSKTGVKYLPTADNSLKLTDSETRGLEQVQFGWIMIKMETWICLSAIMFNGPLALTSSVHLTA